MYILDMKHVNLRSIYNDWEKFKTHLSKGQLITLVTDLSNYSNKGLTFEL